MLVGREQINALVPRFHRVHFTSHADTVRESVQIALHQICVHGHAVRPVTPGLAPRVGALLPKELLDEKSISKAGQQGNVGFDG